MNHGFFYKYINERLVVADLCSTKIKLAIYPQKREILLMSTFQDQAGLCPSCRHARVIHNNRGSEFYLCRLAEKNPRLPKYPRLPVLSCEGYAPLAHAGASGNTRATRNE